MKKFNLIIVLLVSLNTFSQKCSDKPVSENYKKVMNSLFSKEYKKCSVKIIGEFFREGYVKGYRKPRKLKRKIFFQCLPVGGVPKSTAYFNNSLGDFFVIDKKQSDLIFNLNKGDKIEMVGTTFTQNYFGKELSTYFVVTAINKIEK